MNIKNILNVVLILYSAWVWQVAVILMVIVEEKLMLL